MGSPAVDISWPSSIIESFDRSFNIQIDEGNSSYTLDFLENTKSSACDRQNIPKPPPVPRKKSNRGLAACHSVPKETRDLWEKLFKEGYGADVHIMTDNGSTIAAHQSVLSVASPVLEDFLQKSKVKNSLRTIRIPGVPCDAVRAFVRFLYSSWNFRYNQIVFTQQYSDYRLTTQNEMASLQVMTDSQVVESTLCINISRRLLSVPLTDVQKRYYYTHLLVSTNGLLMHWSYEDEEMQKFVLHLLVLSHSYVVPSLKRVCEYTLEQGWLTKENVIDVLQLARSCDAPRLALFCLRMVVSDFKFISSTEAWKVMRRANPPLEQELLESAVEADSRKQERLKKVEERKVYIQLHEAMEALLHICREGCRTIGPRDKMLKGSQIACGFPACKGLETLISHFSRCKTKVPGGCVHCKRMWQLLELHSRMCNDPEYCKVPLCRHFKVKILQQSKKEEAKWRVLVSKVTAAKNAQKLLGYRRSSF